MAGKQHEAAVHHDELHSMEGAHVLLGHEDQPGTHVSSCSCATSRLWVREVGVQGEGVPCWRGPPRCHGQQHPSGNLRAGGSQGRAGQLRWRWDCFRHLLPTWAPQRASCREKDSRPLSLLVQGNLITMQPSFSAEPLGVCLFEASATVGWRWHHSAAAPCHPPRAPSRRAWPHAVETFTYYLQTALDRTLQSIHVPRKPTEREKANTLPTTPGACPRGGAEVKSILLGSEAWAFGLGKA